MRLLIVEDSEETVDLFIEALGGKGVVPVVARDRDDALSKVSSSDFDLVVCDLKIPSVANALDSSVQHGIAVLAEIRAQVPGVPVIAFSAHGTSPDLLSHLLEMAEKADFLGLGVDEKMLSFLNKSEFKECVDAILRVSSEIGELSAIEITPGGLGLTIDQKRALRLFARRRGGRVVRAGLLGGGLSGAKVLRLQIDGASGELVGRYVAKIDVPEALVDERARHQNLVSGVLDLGAAPGVTDLILAGASRSAALLYELADNYDDSVFSILGIGDQRDIVETIRSRTAPWLAGAPTSETDIADLRESLISAEAVDDAIVSGAPLDRAEVDAFDSIRVQARTCVQHADLHGLNVLVAEGDRIVLIDWGEARKAPASLDPVTLEMSVLFHPDSPFRDGEWPSLEQAENWHDLDAYLVDCPLPLFVRACREWAVDASVSAGFREIAAVVGSYSLRQTKYDGANVERALALFRGSVTYLNSE